MAFQAKFWPLAVTVLAAAACSGGDGVSTVEPAHPIASAGSSPSSVQYAALKKSADSVQAMNRDAVQHSYPTAFGALGYDPLTAEYLDRVQTSALSLSDAERAALGKNGFVISSAHEYPTFVRGYAEIYAAHLPVYISADALLEAIHSSYDDVLAFTERVTLVDRVEKLLRAMQGRLPRVATSARVRADVDEYLAVALSLLDGLGTDPVAGGDASAVQAIVAKATAADGMDTLKLFGTTREEDFSQFEPRGHYAGDSRLEQYFRAMIWLGRVDLRLIETMPNGSQVFNREQYDAMLAIRDVIGDDLDSWRQIDDALKLFIGESDNMVVPQIDRLVADLGGAAAARGASDDAVVKALVKGGYGEQQIASYLMVNDGEKTLPLNRSFLVFGQRYIVDSNVFSAVVYDRVLDKTRLMPNPLEAAFGALGNNQGFALDPDVSKYEAVLPGALARVRVLVDSNDAKFWESSLYNLWLASLRTLSPAPDQASREAGLPKLATSEAWGKRVLNTQLGSWAELRHDTLLYAKQSYSGIPSCDFPDAYVDPYPELYAAIGKYAALGMQVASFLPANAGNPYLVSVSGYFTNLGQAASILEQIARAELAGDALTADQLAFINDAVRVERQSVVCTTIDEPNGWLAKLYLDPAKSIVFDPTIADVHTQPADATGNPVGYVLHVGTGYPRLMVATVDSCGGAPRAYAGVVFAYHEQITKDFQRLTDQDWSQNFSQGGTRPADVDWLSDVLAR